MKVAFLSVCFRAFFWVHKSISGNAHHVHQYIFLISFFSALSLNALLSDEKSKKQKVRRETRAIARDGPSVQTKNSFPGGKRKVHVGFRPFFLLFFFFGCCGAEWTFFTFFLGVVSCVCAHIFSQKRQRARKSHSRARKERCLRREI